MRQPCHVPDQDAQVVDRERDDPERGLRAPVEEAGDDDEYRRQCRDRHQAKHGPEQVGVALAGDRVEPEVEQANDQIRDPEQHRVGVECLGDGEGDDEHRRHGREHARAHNSFLGLERVRQPGVTRPRPPERGQDEQPLAEPVPRWVI